MPKKSNKKVIVPKLKVAPMLAEGAEPSPPAKFIDPKTGLTMWVEHGKGVVPPPGYIEVPKVGVFPTPPEGFEYPGGVPPGGFPEGEVPTPVPIPTVGVFPTPPEGYQYPGGVPPEGFAPGEVPTPVPIPVKPPPLFIIKPKPQPLPRRVDLEEEKPRRKRPKIKDKRKKGKRVRRSNVFFPRYRLRGRNLWGFK